MSGAGGPGSVGGVIPSVMPAVVRVWVSVWVRSPRRSPVFGPGVCVKVCVVLRFGWGYEERWRQKLTVPIIRFQISSETFEPAKDDTVESPLLPTLEKLGPTSWSQGAECPLLELSE